MKVYISGPMTGQEDLNTSAFWAAELLWLNRGWTPINPHHNFGGRQDLPREVYMRADYHHLLQADAIALLPGWQGSEGALSELNFAREIGLEIFDALTGLPMNAGVRLTGYVDE